MDRDLILENFQVISQIQDYEECIQILESVDWNLESALNSIDQGNSFATPESHSGFQYETIDPFEFTNNENRDLLFNVDVKGQTLKIVIDNGKTVGDLSKLVALKINEPNSSFKISGLKMPYDHRTQLKDLNLPIENHVAANQYDSSIASSRVNKMHAFKFTKQKLVFEGVAGVGFLQFTPFPRKKIIPEIKKYNLSIAVSFDGKYYQNLNLTFDGKDTIGKVKTHVGTLLGSSTHNWTGWPDHVWGDDISLKNCGISENASFTVNVLPDHKIPKTQSRFRPECNKTPVEGSLNNSRIEEPENEEEDDYYDYPEDIELEQETEGTTKRSVALMNQDAHNDPMTATLQFSHEFSSRYILNTSKPLFFIGSIEDAVFNTLNLPPNKRKPLFLYFHHGESIQANIFCTEVLCYSNILNFFNQSDYMIWPWDVTFSENRAQLMSWLKRCFGSQIILHVSNLQKDQFPILIALSKSQGNVEILEVLDGGKPKDDILVHLVNIKSIFEEKQEVDILAWEEQELRKRVKMEQDEAYQESLSRDQIKEKERDDRKRKIEEDEKNKILEKQKSEEERNNRIQKAASIVPREPADAADAITIRLRLPPNIDIAPSSLNALTRRFLDSHTLAHLLAYVESMGFLRNEFNLLMTYPRTNLTQLPDHDISLKSLGIPKRETLIIERV